METNFYLKEELAGAAGAGTASVTAPVMSVEDAYVNGYLPELSFHSVLQPLSLTMANLSPFDGGVSFHSQWQTPAVTSSSPVRYAFVGEEFLKMETQSHRGVLDQELKGPVHEGLNTKEFAFELLKLNNDATSDAAFAEPLINFFTSSPPTNPTLGMIDRTDFTGHFSHLALQNQKSLELPQLHTASEKKHIYCFHPTEPSSSSFSKNQIKSASVTMKPSSAGVARRKRQRLSDKIRCLEKLLPWNRRMDMTTMLEEAYKYVKFLQAQIRVLQSMPIHSTTASYSSRIANENPNLNKFGGGVLARLNRKQLLEVVMNSAEAQTVLYSRGCCVYSVEQLLLLKKMAEKAAMEQIFFHSAQY